MFRLHEAQRAFLRKHLGLDEGEVADAAEITSSQPLRSPICLSGAAVLAASTKNPSLSRRELIAQASALGAVLLSLDLQFCSLPLAGDIAGTRLVPISQKVQSDLLQIFGRSINDISLLSKARTKFHAEGEFAARNVMQRLLQYRFGGIFLQEGTTATSKFWDMTIPDDSGSLVVYRNLFKSREFLRIGDGIQARLALHETSNQTINSLTQALNIEMMTSGSLEELAHSQNTKITLDRVSGGIGEIWKLDASGLLKLVKDLGPVVIIAYHESKLLDAILCKQNIVETAGEIMLVLSQIARSAPIDISKECWNGCLLASFIINKAGDPEQGRTATNSVLGLNHFFDETPSVEAEIKRAYSTRDHQMMFALFQRMENCLAGDDVLVGQKIFNELHENYYSANILHDPLFARRFGTLGRRLGYEIDVIQTDLIPVTSKFIFLTERT